MIHWALRRKELCDPGLCPDAPDEGGRCDHCPLDKLDAAQSSQQGMIVSRALSLLSALKLGIQISMDEVCADEFWTMLVISEMQDAAEREKTALEASGQ
ncbi:MAG: hypothetical protein KJZ78_00245 [Bryobacteraceae bacterium]|nr:hypothetical protein [Bryobacteraceae bacterium]